jgi:hypothetical protein
MLRNALIVITLMLLALGIADARLPQVGDQVKIVTALNDGIYGVEFDGKVTDVENGLICLSCTFESLNNLRDSSYPFDVCIGVGSIVSLTWV